LLDPVFVGLTIVGYGGFVWIALAPLVAHFTRASLLRTTGLVIASVWASDLVASLLKALVDRPRPFERIPEADPLIHGIIGNSFPSGHAATSAAGALVLSLVAPRAAPYFALLAGAIAFSRVYAGVHYPLDVIAGALVGFAVAGLVLAAVRLLLPTSGGRRQPAVPPTPD
jgi:undecaprenyl-diphosphatase